MSDNNEQKAKKEANRIYPLSGASEALDNQSKRFREAFLKGYKHAESENTALKLEVERLNERNNRYKEALTKLANQSDDMIGWSDAGARARGVSKQALKEDEQGPQ